MTAIETIAYHSDADRTERRPDGIGRRGLLTRSMSASHTSLATLPAPVASAHKAASHAILSNPRPPAA